MHPDEEEAVLAIKQEDAGCLAREHSEFQFCRTVLGVIASD
jgi:hypothetical protein